MTTPIQGLCSMATRGLLDELASTYAQHTGVPASFLAIGGVEAARRVSAGEPFDVVVLASDAIDKLVAAGKLDAAGKTDLVRSGVAAAVRAGAPRPEISTEEALRSSVLAAPRIAYSTGPSGTALMALFERWGIAGDMRSRLVQAPPGVPVGSLLARGEAELGFQQLSELIGACGIELIGPLRAKSPTDANLQSRHALYLIKMGDRDAATKLVSGLIDQPKLQAQILYRLTVIFELAGERDRALSLLRRTLAAGYPAKEVAAEPELIELRADARYQRLLDEISAATR